jgi:hypothetical protein
MIRFLPVLIVVGFVLLCCTPALADGKVFTRGVAAPPPIPDQQAIIAWDRTAGIESLAIETRFEASKLSGSTPAADARYAWVIPLPGPEAPTIAAATQGLFPTVRTVFQPHVDDRRSPGSIPFTIAVSLLLIVYVGLRALGHSVGAIIVVILLAFLVVFALLPTLGSARGLGDGPSTVRVLQREIIGSYEASVIGTAAEKNGGVAIAEWLRENGFAAPAAVEPVLADYTKRNWVFAAIKLRPDTAAAGAMLTPHPLVFRFKTAKAVYPMALTGVGNAPLTLDMYVFGSKRAAAEGLNVVRCDEVRSIRDEYPRTFPPESCVGVLHPALKSIAGTCGVATKLSGTLSPAQQAHDMEIGWSSFARVGSHKFSERGARNRAIEWGVGTVPIAIVAMILLALAKSLGPKWTFPRLWWAGAAGCLVGLVIYMASPTVEVISGGARMHRYLRGSMQELYSQSIEDTRGRTTRPTVEEARAIVAAAAKTIKLDAKLEDSPGNYTIEDDAASGDLNLVWYDAIGGPQREPIWWTERAVPTGRHDRKSGR